MKKTTISLFLFAILFIGNYLGQTNHTVSTAGMSFSPSSLTINANDTVTFICTSGTHNVNGTQATFPNNPESFGNSLGSSWTFQHIFTIAGTYDYQCDPHAGGGMVGSIIVNSASVSHLNLTAIFDLTIDANMASVTNGSQGKAILVTANQNIADLSTYGLGSATNGGGSDGEEFTFPSISINSGQHVLVCRDSTGMSNYFDGCLEQFPGAIYPTIFIENTSEPTGNGNDAYELFHNGSVIETFGDINHSFGTGGFTSLPWAYRDSWAWKDTAQANIGNWVYGGDNCSDGSVSTQSSNCPFPLCGFTPPPVANCCDYTLEVTDSSGGGVRIWVYNNNPFLQTLDTTIFGDPNILTTLFSFSSCVGDSIHIIDAGPNLNTAQSVDIWTLYDPHGQEIFNSVNNNSTWLGGSQYSPPINQCSGVQISNNITLSVNTANITVGPNGMYAGGGVLGGADAVALSDPDGDGTWTGMAAFPAAGGNYVFLNSPANGGDWAAKEDLTGLSCADGQYNDRLMPALTADTIILACFGSCETDGTCPTPQTPQSNVTFKVDMSQVTAVFTNPEVNATFNSWCGNCNSMTDADGDEIWEVTIPLDSGLTIEYKFSADSWSIQEQNDPNSSCTNGNATNTNRVLTVPATDTVLTEVCWGSCDPCSSGIIQNGLNTVKVYPNPVSDVLNIKSIEKLNSIIVKDLTGRVVMLSNPNSINLSLDVSLLSNNIYFVECRSTNGLSIHKIIISN